jgi:hypothetical protein
MIPNPEVKRQQNTSEKMKAGPQKKPNSLMIYHGNLQLEYNPISKLVFEPGKKNQITGENRKLVKGVPIRMRCICS